MVETGYLKVLQTKARGYGAWIIAIFHVVGLILLGGPWRTTLVVLTPLNLLLLSGLYFLASDRPRSWGWYAAPIVLGFFVEAIGTNTGFPFGNYAYSSVLGWGVLHTPFLIGVLWWVLLRSWYDVLGRWLKSKFWRSFATGLGMVGLDFFIEPVAIENNFWAWEQDVVPVENYVAWFGLSMVFALLTHKGDAKNTLSLPVLLILSGFFIVLGAVYAW